VEEKKMRYVQWERPRKSKDTLLRLVVVGGKKQETDLRSNEGASVVVGKGTDDDEDDIDDVPDTESSGGGELQERRDDVSEVEAVNSRREGEGRESKQQWAR